MINFDCYYNNEVNSEINGSQGYFFLKRDFVM